MATGNGLAVGPPMHDPAALTPWLTRERLQVIALAGVTVLALYLCYLIARPFIPAVAWAVALTLVARPAHRWILARVTNENLAAALAVALVAVAILVPIGFVVQQVVVEAQQMAERFRSGATVRDPVALVEQSPWLAGHTEWLREYVDVRGQVRQATLAVAGWISEKLAGSAWAAVELLIVLFILFYLFRDRHHLARAARYLVPLSSKETDAVFTRVDETIHATVYGTLVVAAVQGALGAAIFWWLGLPAPLLWGVVMGLLAVVPVLGAFVVWVPAAAGLALAGEWGKALILTGWGTVVIGLIDNLLYPVLVGRQLRLHTVPVFVAIVGGLVAFGAAGVIIGPAVVAATGAVLDIWRRRTAHGRAADQGQGAPTELVLPSGSA